MELAAGFADGSDVLTPSTQVGGLRRPDQSKGPCEQAIARPIPPLLLGPWSPPCLVPLRYPSVLATSGTSPDALLAGRLPPVITPAEAVQNMQKMAEQQC
jgi:hypothetical protein